MEKVKAENLTAVDVYQWLREVCTTKIIQTPIVLDGCGVVNVEIDESGTNQRLGVLI